MKRWFWRKPSPLEVLRVPEIMFLGEQDGDVEKEFKRRLLDRFATSTTLHDAYLVRATYDGSPQIRVVLALDANPGGHIVLREEAHEVFAKMFSSTESLDILFLNEERKRSISTVAKPFQRKANRQAL